MKIKLPRLQKSSGGFTIIEIMVVMTVIAILAGIVLYGLGKAQASARDAQRQQIMTGLQTALERYYGDNQRYPEQANWGNMFTFGNAGPPVTGGLCGVGASWVQGSACISGYYLSDIPRDPNCSGPLTNGAWRPCGAAALPSYHYENPDGTHCTGSALPNGYQLRLVKESGGTSYFCSPN